MLVRIHSAQVGEHDLVVLGARLSLDVKPLYLYDMFDEVDEGGLLLPAPLPVPLG
jgi:hypothetical protein